MSNLYRFVYDSGYDEESIYGESCTIDTKHYFNEDATWVPILWQFAKFLESTGYSGVTEKIVIKSNIPDYDLGDAFFETIYEESDWKKELDEAEEELEKMDWEKTFPKDNEDKDAN